MNNTERLPKWILMLKSPILAIWRIYYVCTIRIYAIKHWTKGEIPLREMISILRPRGLAPKQNPDIAH